MLKNILTTAWRNLLRSKIYSLLNVVGLAIGMACCLIILAFVYNELNYDRHHENAERVFRVAEIFEEDGVVVEESASIGFPVGPTIEKAYPGTKTTRFYKTFEKIPLLTYEDKRFYEEKLFFTDSTVFDIFTFPMILGDPNKALAAPFSIVLTENMAAKYFGEEDPLGKTITFENTLDFTVTGVIENIPPTSHIKFDFLASLLNLGEIFKASGTTFSWSGWYWNPCHTYVLLPEDMSAEKFNSLLPNFHETHVPERMRDNLTFFLQPLTDIHLHSSLYQELEVNGSKQTVYLFSIIALFVLFIACINFMNLATARSMKRAKEIAVRKAVGANRRQLVWQFLGESILLSFIAAGVAFILVEISLPIFEQISGTELNLNLIGYEKIIGALSMLALLVGIIAGSYPALFLSSFKPVDCLSMSSYMPSNWSSVFLRKGLVVFQFCISIVLLIGMVVIQKQHNYLKEKELGFDKEQLVMIPVRGTDIKAQNKIEAFKQRLNSEPTVLATSAVSNIVGRDVQICPFRVEGVDEVQQISGLFVDFDFEKTFGINLKEGRSHSLDFTTDSFAYVLNQAAVEQFGWDENLGKRITYGREGQVIGVAENFNFSKLQERIRPLAITVRPGWFSYVAVRLGPGNVSSSLKKLESAWKEFEPARPFSPFFLDDNLNQLYEKEARLGKIFTAFSFLAIIIGCLGLFGLATFSAERRLKEIGVRRVLGASVTGVVGLLSKEFLSLVILSLVIASPIAYYFLNDWLAHFPFRVALDGWTFLLAGAIAVGIAFLTVSYQSIKAALTNPVESLRSE